MIVFVLMLDKHMPSGNMNLFGIYACAEMMRYHEISLPLQRMLIAVAELATVEM